VAEETAAMEHGKEAATTVEPEPKDERPRRRGWWQRR